MRTFLMRQFTLGEDDVYACDGPVNLMRLMAVPDLVDRPDLKYPDFTPSLTTQLAQNSDLFEAIRQGDVLLHHPFQSFAPVVEFVRQAASDPSVLAIKQTLYRTEADSAPAQALVDAARAGKEVTVVIELLARFDEQANIALADQLQAAGAHVVYGVVGHKTHAKMLLVLRREGRALRRYVHLGTGNYHTGTARAYTDFGLLSSENALGEDVHKVFQQLTALGKAGKLKQALQSPFTLHRAILDYIKGETELARKGEKARIIAKMNALIEPEIIQALYVASRAGVKIDLIIRGICALRPGIKGVSENISVRSVVGRFLEHARVFYFYAAGREHVYLSSADWMGRNFFNRVELAVPVHEETLKKRVIKEGLMEYLGDNQQAWVLNRDGSYHRLQPGSNKPRGAQAGLLAELAGE
jgi:polyphosphate kinase